MNVDPIDFFPGYDPCRLTTQRSTRCCSGIWTNIFAVVFSVIICTAGISYYEYVGKHLVESWKSSSCILQENSDIHVPVEKLRQEIEMIKGKIDQTDIWRKHLEDLYTKIYHQQESAFQKKLETALDLYDSDKIGLFDYAATYSGGSVHSIQATTAYPINKTISFFRLVNIDVLSNPESLLQASNLPGNCFAFAGTEGRIRIKLAKEITIRAVTMDHIRLYEDRTNAPKDFSVYGLEDPDDFNNFGTLLGNFTYDINGRLFQTFPINKNAVFEYVELHILSNYGKKEFTCVYRFRVHNIFVNPPVE